MGYGMDEEEWFGDDDLYLPGEYRRPDYDPKRKVRCPECGKNVKEVGLKDHTRDKHQ